MRANNRRKYNIKKVQTCTRIVVGKKRGSTREYKNKKKFKRLKLLLINIEWFNRKKMKQWANEKNQLGISEQAAGSIIKILFFNFIIWQTRISMSHSNLNAHFPFVLNNKRRTFFIIIIYSLFIPIVLWIGRASMENFSSCSLLCWLFFFIFYKVLYILTTQMGDEKQRDQSSLGDIQLFKTFMFVLENNRGMKKKDPKI